MQNIEWLFFDLGSTLIDEKNVYERIFQDIASQARVDLNDIKLQSLDLWKRNKIGDIELCKIYNLPKRKWYTEYEKLYDGVPVMLYELKQKYKLGIIANQLAGLKDRLTNWGILKCFDLVIFSAEVGIAKPDLQIFKLAVGQANCDACNAVMIGDRIDNDIIPAKKVGMRTVWVKQGYGGLWNIKGTNEQPDFQVDDILNISKIL